MLLFENHPNNRFINEKNIICCLPFYFNGQKHVHFPEGTINPVLQRGRKKFSRLCELRKMVFILIYLNRDRFTETEYLDLIQYLRENHFYDWASQVNIESIFHWAYELVMERNCLPTNCTQKTIINPLFRLNRSERAKIINGYRKKLSSESIIECFEKSQILELKPTFANYAVELNCCSKTVSAFILKEGFLDTFEDIQIFYRLNILINGKDVAVLKTKSKSELKAIFKLSGVEVNELFRYIQNWL